MTLSYSRCLTNGRGKSVGISGTLMAGARISSTIDPGRFYFREVCCAFGRAQPVVLFFDLQMYWSLARAFVWHAKKIEVSLDMYEAGGIASSRAQSKRKCLSLEQENAVKLACSNREHAVAASTFTILGTMLAVECDLLPDLPPSSSISSSKYPFHFKQAGYP